ncbi:UDP-N-acetylglucosamine--N-acetylmuramyl-(pentapeptide) pyrophosphoryl-undecaprenol N-acetylglucosamine transferase [Corynebacterium qintianiae]|uniref:UDP-N-acetylglucosamine--N-acetylmuramyl- (pentapeptide) pyrophosphoryl-undecaprenol N-acetylglucosamine transferase n=1 Tax=Corynebacterium qintianiae TaxID=2709392 RepID=UPI0013EC7A5C|nr:UDP-N-acetylglucosamine--N-acetylmuramyl-(pentapeptide) pyrophosphoryl-undecaprenol N-acetylglucosamine transferase [Corynebacterium qintianiae]
MAGEWLIGLVALLLVYQRGFAAVVGTVLLALVLAGASLAAVKPPSVLRLLRWVTGRGIPAPALTSGEPRILFLTSNGAGLGHLTRVFAIANALKQADYLVLTLSSGFHKVPLPRQKVRYFPSYGSLGMDTQEWEKAYEMNLASVIRTYTPHVVVFDGAYVYRPITKLCRKYGIQLIWVQRGCWKEHVDRSSIQRHNADLVADEVIIPGDYGCDEVVDLGPQITPSKVSPIIAVSRSRLRSRNDACTALGLDPSKRYVLIQLGAGVLNELEDLRRAVIDNIPRGLTPVVTRNPLKAQTNGSEVIEVESYPIAENFAAFEFGIMAAGYNSVQEAVGLGLPCVFVPNLETATDDQLQRAEGVHALGFGLKAADAAELKNAIASLSQPEIIGHVRGRLDSVIPADGAQQAAKLLELRLLELRSAQLRK